MIGTHGGRHDDLVQIIVRNVHGGVEEARVRGLAGQAPLHRVRVPVLLPRLDQVDHLSGRVQLAQAGLAAGGPALALNSPKFLELAGVERVGGVVVEDFVHDFREFLKLILVVVDAFDSGNAAVVVAAAMTGLGMLIVPAHHKFLKYLVLGYLYTADELENLISQIFQARDGQPRNYVVVQHKAGQEIFAARGHIPGHGTTGWRIRIHLQRRIFGAQGVTQ
mmetsp:Transcript_26985/g.63362  ORF Transcript_26985/g.63362 Transcript_26985/m.63362 type:complete len:221 (-) Transcript_26985:340-1002(-)